MSHFTYHNISLSTGQHWEVAKALIVFNSQLYTKATSQSKQKSQFTMDASQSGKKRSPELKFQMQLMGILAEIFAQEYLKEIIAAGNLSANWVVIRYDDVRTDGFKSPANEYDIKIQSINGAREFKVESRSSIARDRSLKTAIEQFDIIGPYSSVTKSAEELSDFFVRPLYEFLPFDTTKYLPSNFERHLKADEIKLYIVAGCTKKDMIEKGYDKDMNQDGTLYKVVKITNGYDVKSFNQVLTNVLK